MNLPASPLWLQLIVVLTLETVLFVGLAALAQRSIVSAVWRRIIWQICFVGLTLVACAELTGMSGGLARLVQAFNAGSGDLAYKDRAAEFGGLVSSPDGVSRAVLTTSQPSNSERAARPDRGIKPTINGHTAFVRPEPVIDLHRSLKAGDGEGKPAGENPVVSELVGVQASGPPELPEFPKVSLSPKSNDGQSSSSPSPQDPLPLSPSLSPAPSGGEGARRAEEGARFVVAMRDRRIVEAPPELPGAARAIASRAGREQVHSFQSKIQNPKSKITQALGLPALIWLLGCAAMLGRLVFARLLLALFRRRCQPVTHQGVHHLLGELSRRVGFRSQVRLIQSRRLRGPIAFGVIRPCIGLPEKFDEQFNPAQKQAMLAHELAHLAARDPLWSLLTELLLALLWWNPLLWWARSQFNQASEAAADEASLLAEGGPQVLAECLLQLGSRLDRPQPGIWMGIEGRGLKSGLAQRVERLLHLDERTWRPPNRLGCALVRAMAPIGLALLVIFGAAWVGPPTHDTATPNERETVMMTLKQSWHRSAAALALTAAFTGSHPAAFAAEPAKPPLERSAPPSLATKSPDPAKLNALKGKLERITLGEVAYDSMPLVDVVQHLIAESTKRDPDKAGVNFLFSQSRESLPAAVDPQTGLPIVAVAEAVDLRAITVRISPPLKNVRLIDALDAITKVADRPIKYSVQEYAVIISLAPLGGDVELMGLAVRTFRINTNSFFSSVEKTFGVPINNDSPARQQDGLRSFLSKIGVNMDSASKTVFYNEDTGILMVRAFPTDLDLAEAAIATLGGSTETASSRPSAGTQRSVGAGVEDTISKVLQAIGNAAPPSHK